MTPAGNLTSSFQIAAYPVLVTTQDAEVIAFLTGLGTPDFRVIEETKALWALEAESEGSGTAYVVSAEAHIYLKAHRY